LALGGQAGSASGPNYFNLQETAALSQAYVKEETEWNSEKARRFGKEEVLQGGGKRRAKPISSVVVQQRTA
jgi:hypothetical protein